MARRRTRRKTTRRRSPKPMINLLNFAEGFIVANAGTKAVFGTDVVPFFLDGIVRDQTASTNNSWEISMKELFLGLTGQSNYGMASSFSADGRLMDAIKHNLMRSGPQLATIVLAPVAFKAGKRIARKPISQMNKGIKALGLGSTIKI